MLHIHRAERADGLVEALGDLVSDALDDPMAPEVVAVPTRGVERWVAQRLSARLGAQPGRGDGVCANFGFPFPGRLVGDAVAAASGLDRDTDPWLPQRLVWPLLDVVDACLPEGWLASLAAHVGAAGTPGTDADAQRSARRFATVRHIADLYDRYGVHRPEMLSAWAAGDDTDGGGRPLPQGAAWQAELWRRLRARIAGPSPAERLAGACDRLREDEALVDLPARLSLFGLTRLPASYLQVLAALSARRDVHLFVLHPSPVLWAQVKAATRQRPPVVRRAEDFTAGIPRNPLLASWGRDAREMQLVLAADHDASGDDHRPVSEPATTLLARIQADVRADRCPPGVPLPGQADTRPVLAPGDESLQIHACHGPDRQVEVIRDAIAHLLQEDPTLQARDIIVMCPDIEAFAPLIHATFGAGDVDGDKGDGGRTAGDGWPPDFRMRLADRSLRQTNPVLGAVSEVLELASARLSAAQVLDLAGREPLRRRFGFDDDDLSRLEAWVGDSGVHWGLDAAHRQPFRLGWLDANTWHAGLDRMLLGVAAAVEGQRLIGGVLPLDDLPSGDIALAGRFAEFIDRLEAALGSLAGPKAVDAWAEAISVAADSLTATTGRDAWQRAQLQELLDGVVTEATTGAAVNAARLTLPEIRSLLADRLRGRPTRANFRTGHLTACTLVPMRSVPHRVVCLLGLDDGVFPRRGAPDGDDIIGADPHVGDRDARAEDRQLLLDALLAATGTLVITYSGRDERTNAGRPPAVVVGELLDVVDRTVRAEKTAERAPPVAARGCVVVQHPLQPFDVRNFTAGALVARRAWSFDTVLLYGARALSGDRLAVPPFLAGPLPRGQDGAVELGNLVAFVEHPVKAFLRQRLNISLRELHTDPRDGVPVELDHLEEWAVGQHLLEGRLAGGSAQDCAEAEIARGILPPGSLATRILDRITPTVEELVGEASALVAGAGAPGSMEINLRLAGGRLLVGTVAGVRADLLVSVTYSRVKPKHRLAAWVRFLAATAAYPDRRFQAATIGRSRFGAGWGTSVTVARLGPFPGLPGERRERALAHLGTLLDLYDRGMREPLPLYCETSAAYAAAPPRRDPRAEARKAWETEESGKFNFDREDRDPAHHLVLGGVRTLDEVLAAPPCQDEAGDGWASGEASRFGRYARRLWDGLLASETVTDR